MFTALRKLLCYKICGPLGLEIRSWQLEDCDDKYQESADTVNAEIAGFEKLLCQCIFFYINLLGGKNYPQVMESMTGGCQFGSEE